MFLCKQCGSLYNENERCCPVEVEQCRDCGELVEETLDNVCFDCLSDSGKFVRVREVTIARLHEMLRENGIRIPANQCQTCLYPECPCENAECNPNRCSSAAECTCYTE